MCNADTGNFIPSHRCPFLNRMDPPTLYSVGITIIYSLFKLIHKTLTFNYLEHSHVKSHTQNDQNLSKFLHFPLTDLSTCPLKPSPNKQTLNLFHKFKRYLHKRYSVVQNKIPHYRRYQNMRPAPISCRIIIGKKCFLYSGTYSIELQTVFSMQEM